MPDRGFHISREILERFDGERVRHPYIAQVLMNQDYPSGYDKQKGKTSNVIFMISGNAPECSIQLVFLRAHGAGVGIESQAEHVLKVSNNQLSEQPKVLLISSLSGRKHRGLYEEQFVELDKTERQSVYKSIIELVSHNCLTG